MNIPAWISTGSLALVAVLCIVGVLAHSYKDNLFERIGMAFVCGGCVARIYGAWHDSPPPPSALLLHVGIALFAIGSGWAKFRNWRGKS